MSNKLNIQQKEENNGTNARGRLTANEFNQVVNAVNAHEDQLGGVSLVVLESSEAYEALTTKDENTLYFILE